MVIGMILVGCLFIAAAVCAGRRQLSQEMAVNYASIAEETEFGYNVYESPVHLKVYRWNETEYYSYQEDVKTLYEGFQEACRKHTDKLYLGQPVPRENGIEYVWYTYGKINELVNNVATALYTVDGVREGNKICINSINRYEWMLLDHACSAMSAITVPVGPDTSKEDMVQICNENNIRVIFTDKKNFVKVFDSRHSIPSLKKIVAFDHLPEDFVPDPDYPNLVASFDIYLAERKDCQPDFKRPTPKSIVTICYTSGTTGKPKGVIHTHGNIMAQLASVLVLSSEGKMIKFDPEILHLSYLPLNHIFERIIQYALVVAGGRCGFFRGDRKLIPDDAKVLRPTIFVAVPLVLNRVYDGVMAQVQKKNRVARWIFNWVLKKRIEKFSRGVIKKTWYERFVFKSITDAFGGQVKAIISGAAPLSVELIKFFQAIFECCIQGYGQSETGGAVTTPCLQDVTAGHVGGIIPGVQFALIKPKNLDHECSELELCLRGPTLSPGYYVPNGDPIPLIDDDGWFRTDDAAVMLDNGAIQITGRLGDIVKLNTGFFVNLTKITTALQRSELYSQICVTAESKFACTVAIVVPKNSEGDHAELAKKILAEFQTYMQRKDDRKLASYEVPGAVIIAREPFTEETKELTSSQKVKRKVVHKNYIAEISSAYEAISAKPQ